jgi:hypothetical protein
MADSFYPFATRHLLFAKRLYAMLCAVFYDEVGFSTFNSFLSTLIPLPPLVEGGRWGDC